MPAACSTKWSRDAARVGIPFKAYKYEMSITRGASSRSAIKSLNKVWPTNTVCGEHSASKSRCASSNVYSTALRSWGWAHLGGQLW